MKTWSKIGIGMLVIMLSALPFLAACGGDDDEKEPTDKVTPTDQTTPSAKTTEPAGKKTEITIGNLTDLTGPASVAMQSVHMGFQDIVRYYNDNDLIPGVEVEIVTYDGMMDPSKDKPGWEWLKDKGADVMVAWMPYQAMSLQPLAEKDSMPLFLANVPSELMETPGHVFATAPLFEDLMWNLIKWVIENDWDYQTKGPAKVGLAADEAGNPVPLSKGFEAYAKMYPERMTWVGAQVIPAGSYLWQEAVEGLKDCDYIYTPNIWPMFVKAYSSAGYTKAKFLGSDSQTSFFKIGNEMNLWPKIDGMLFVAQSEWWGEESEYADLSLKLVNEYRAGSLAGIQEAGKGYNSTVNGMLILESIKNAAAKVGPENVDSQAIYEGAQSVKVVFDGVQRFSFTEVKRLAVDRLAIYKADSANKTMVRVSAWFPVESVP